MVEKPSKLQPALAGGAILGVLSVIPVISACCCIWGLAGGALAAWMLIKRSPALPVTTGDGMSVGAFSGVVGSGITLLITVPLNMLNSAANITAMRQSAERFGDPGSVEPFIEMMASSPLLFALMVWFIAAVIIVAFSTLGGLFGVMLFEKRKGQTEPPEPPADGPPLTY